MGTARNEITGDAIKTKPNTKAYQDEYSRIFGEKPVVRGRFKRDPETGKFIPASEWYQKYGGRTERGPMIFVDKFEPYVSPIDERVISTRRQHKYDLDASGCRVYEGRQQEEKEAAKYRREQESKVESRIDHTLHQTHYDIQHGYLKPKE